MTVSKFEVVAGDKKAPCPYCGKQPHPVPLACPRIRSIVVYDDEDKLQIHFWPDDGEESPDAA